MTAFSAFLPSKASSWGLKSPLSLSRDFASNLRCGLVGSEPKIIRVSQEPIGGPGQIGNFRYQLRLNPVHARKNERRTEAGLARRRRTERRTRSREGVQAAT